MTDQVGDLGNRLRQAREKSGLSLRCIADATKLSVRNLSALENNRVEQLPGGIYRRSIVRMYAAHVGLDPEQTLRAFLAKHPDDVPTWDDLLPPASRPRPTMHGVISVMSALIPILAGVFYFSLDARSDAPQHIVDVMPMRGDVMQASMIPAALTASTRGDDSVAMMVSVSAATALQIVADGHEVAARRFEPGDVIRLSLGSDVVLLGDNAGAVHFSINGRAGRTLGDDGSPLTARISRDDYQNWLMAH